MRGDFFCRVSPGKTVKTNTRIHLDECMCVLCIKVITKQERKEPKGEEDVEYRETNGGRERRRKTDG